MAKIPSPVGADETNRGSSVEDGEEGARRDGVDGKDEEVTENMITGA
jgi:hypothetical protein